MCRNSTDLPGGVARASVKTVVLPAAGMVTCFLPATKTVPKELLPVVDYPGHRADRRGGGGVGGDASGCGGGAE